jgi:hypothetical protein
VPRIVSRRASVSVSVRTRGSVADSPA